MGKSTTSGAGAGSTLPEYKESANVRSEGLNVHRYPTDVGSPEYPNYIMFNIIQRAGDIGNAEQVANAQAGPAQGKKILENVSSRNRSDQNAKLAGAMGQVVGIFNGFEVGSDLVSGFRKYIADKLPAGELISGGAGKIVGNVAGVIAATAAKKKLQEVTTNRERVVLKTTIALHLNNKPSATYKAQWADADLGIIGGASKDFQDMANTVSKVSLEGNELATASRLVQAGVDVGKTFLGAATSASATMAMKKVTDTPLKDFGDVRSFVEAGAGVAINPFKAQLFKNMGFRTFTFDYVFLPRDATEYNSVQTIIKTFKRYMHPTLGKEQYFLGYPAEFNIEYFHKSGQNYEHIFKLAGCALTDLKVDYGGADFVTFRDIGGAPTEISMSLSFLELELLTEERVMEGY